MSDEAPKAPDPNAIAYDNASGRWSVGGANVDRLTPDQAAAWKAQNGMAPSTRYVPVSLEPNLAQRSFRAEYGTAQVLNHQPMVTSPDDPSYVRVAKFPSLPGPVAYDLSDPRNLGLHDRAHERYEPGFFEPGNVVLDAMSCSSGDIRSGTRTETNGYTTHRQDIQYGQGFVKTRVCLDVQLEMQTLQRQHVLCRELLSEPRCGCQPSYPYGFALWSGEPECPKARRERAERLKRHAARQGVIERQFAAGEIERKQREADQVAQAMAGALGPLIDAAVANRDAPKGKR